MSWASDFFGGSSQTTVVEQTATQQQDINLDVENQVGVNIDIDIERLSQAINEGSGALAQSLENLGTTFQEQAEAQAVLETEQSEKLLVAFNENLSENVKLIAGVALVISLFYFYKKG